MSPRAISIAGTTPNAIAVTSRHRDGEQQHAGRRRRRRPRRGSATGDAATSAFTDRHRDDDAERRSHRGEQDALGEELADQAAAARANRRAHRDFALAHRRAREQQARDVGARDHQQERRRAEQREQRRPEEADDFVSRAAPRAREYSPLVDGFSAPRRLVSARSSAFAASGVMPGFSRKSDSMKCAPRLCCVDVPRDAVPHVGVVRILEPRRHHADDGEERTVERDRLADDRRIAAEPLAPQPVADDRDRLARVERRLREPGAERPAGRRARGRSWASSRSR